MSQDIGRPITAPEVQYSAKHNGVCLAAARCLRGVWKRAVVKLATAPAPRAPRPTLSDIVTDTADLLRHLVDFLERYGVWAATAPAAPPARSSRVGAPSSTDAAKAQLDLEARRVCLATER